jgi:hypothetical protein
LIKLIENADNEIKALARKCEDLRKHNILDSKIIRKRKKQNTIDSNFKAILKEKCPEIYKEIVLEMIKTKGQEVVV